MPDGLNGLKARVGLGMIPGTPHAVSTVAATFMSEPCRPGGPLW